MDPAPQAGIRLSIVIAASHGGAVLEQCLVSLKGQAEAPDTEVIVVSNFSREVRSRIQKQFSFVRHVSLPGDATVPVLRTAGIQNARGEIVALAEDHCSFGESWCLELKKAHESPHTVIGGSVENASHQKILDWAVFFYDYGKYMLPNPSGVVRALPGNNVSYKRAVLAEVESLFREGFFETFVHAELRKRGHALFLAPSAIVYHQKSYEFGRATAQCYHLARGFAGKRLHQAPLAKRAAFVLGSLALPLLLPARIVLTILRKGRHIGELLLALPHLVVLMASWSLGEFCGYLAGEGTSTGKWK